MPKACLRINFVLSVGVGIYWTRGAISELCELLTPTDEAAFAATDLEFN